MPAVDTSKLGAPLSTIEVQPSNHLFRELGNNTYDFPDLLSELIDNAIAAARPGEQVAVEIEVGISRREPGQSYVIVRDRAAGITSAKLGDALSPGALSGGSGLNEHGLGLKQAVAGLGSFDYLLTRTSGEDNARLVRELKFGSIPEYPVETDWNHGTEICVRGLSALVPTATQSYTMTTAPTLGARYRRFLRPANPRMSLRIVKLNLDKRGADGEAEKVGVWDINAVDPVYFNPNRRDGSPKVVKKEFKGHGPDGPWCAELTFGYAPQGDDEWQQLGLEPVPDYHPYHVSVTHQGLDLIREDRVIKFYQLSEIGLTGTKHPQWNRIRGELDLIEGFKTSVTKNHVMHTAAFDDLIDKVKAFLDDNKFLSPKDVAWSGELPEKLVEERLASHLRNRAVDPKRDIRRQVSVGKLNGKIDIVADDEPYELKIDQGKGTDVYQLFAYLDMGGYKKGYMIAPSFGSGAEEAAKYINEHHEVEIILCPTSDFPILHPPTAEERERHRI